MGFLPASSLPSKGKYGLLAVQSGVSEGLDILAGKEEKPQRSSPLLNPGEMGHGRLTAIH
jgi:hypothetical protein